MALFDPLAPALLPLLPRLGFSARLRWELSDTYLAASAPPSTSPTSSTSSTSAPCSLTATTHRPSAPLFYFLSNAPLSAAPSLTAVLTKPPASSDFLFLSLHPSPHLTPTPTLLKFSFHPPSAPTRALISLQTPLPPPTFLSLSASPHATSVPSLSKRELFHLEFTPNSIAAGFSVPSHSLSQYLQPTQALSDAILHLGARIRFRSFHDRVLRRGSLAQGIIPILQDAPKTRIDETHHNELVVTPHRVNHPQSSATDDFFIFKDVETGLALSINPDNPQLSRAKTLSETALLLVHQKDAQPIRVRYSTKGWGRVHLGCPQPDDTAQWLMAGRAGRLELRPHLSRWETFQLEVVTQSLEMAVKDVPESPLVRVANQETQRVTRREIEARVQKARAQDGNRKNPVKTPGFDHGRALAGLSAHPQKVTKKALAANATTSSSANVKSNAGDAEGKVKAKTAGNGTVKGAAVAAAATAASLPRNQANRKAAKRNKKKKQKQKAKNAANAASALTAAGNTVSTKNRTTQKPETKQKASQSDLSSKVDKPIAKENENSASALKSAETTSKSGPPCAACGRPLEGSYVTALGKKFHPSCFCCGRCRRPLAASAGKFRERGGIPYCDSCYAAHLAPRCARCSKPIMDTVTTAMGKQWHKSCLTCTICGLELTQTFWLYADKPNEPRCSRCVTGDEQYTGPRRSNGRMVNLPFFGHTGGTGVPLATPSGSTGAPGQGGRARLVHPILPNTTRR